MGNYNFEGTLKLNNKTIATTDQCGTKLYKHTIIFMYQGQQSIDMYNTNSTPIELSNLKPVYMGSEKGFFLDLGCCIQLALTVDSLNLYIKTLTNAGGGDYTLTVKTDSSIPVADVSNFVDTVTPL